MESPRTRALQAAVELLGTEGLRSLTHARIDDRAGLPKGSTSNYFRTRAALLTGVSDWLADVDLQAVGPAFRPTTAAEFVDAMCWLFDLVTRVNRVQTTARLVLFLEGSHDAELRKSLSRGRAALEAGATAALAGLGAPDPVVAAQAVAAMSEGLILHRIARHDDVDPRPAYELIARAVIPVAG
ncbi:TetR/AcrR family transcriptional regulator [Kribbella sp. NPDC056345]|uniref:TetR/AcrR family transcriptional regulator n=1 Tax=Kribbella sp. NPDC056345 TaxID=3345789 RepID=UPI0035E05D11